jgi:ketol-acid reductoisomerase
MATCHFAPDIDETPLANRTIAVIGYGNQGRSQALNLRDSGYRVVIGNRNDDYRPRAIADEMDVLDIAAAASIADVVLLNVPDEAQPEVYSTALEPNLRRGGAICVSHGFNFHFGTIQPRADLDVIMVAPKMIGEFVRSHYVDGSGFASLVAVHADPSGQALGLALALAKAMGGATKGAWVSTFEEETVTDLFGEQAGGASALRSTLFAFETLVEAGYDPDIVALELYASGELADVMRAVSRDGMLNSLFLHSSASRYGQLSRAERMIPIEAKETLRTVLADIQSGAFATELSEVADGGYERVSDLLAHYASHPLFKSEARVREANAGRSPDLAVASTPRAPWMVEA